MKTLSVRYFIVFIGLILFLFTSCKKDQQPAPTPAPAATPVQGIDLSITYKVDAAVLMSNDFMYQTQAGYTYSITKLVYFISRVCLIKADSSMLPLNKYMYVDAFISGTNKVIFANIPEGNYIGMKFNIGLDSLQNMTDSLPATADNINMQWPQMMGGGYHVIKLEGYYKDSTGTNGFAMHVGTNACLVPIKIFKPIVVSKNAKTGVGLVMNINEWFRDPNTFDFDKDGNYIMGNSAAMKKFAQNGVDVFSFL